MKLGKKFIFVHPKIKLLMRLKYCFLVLFLFSFYTLFAQENPRFTLLPWLQPYFNPAAMGEKDNHLNFTGILRQHAAGSRGELDPTNSDDPSNPTNPLDPFNPTGNRKPKGPPQNGEQVLLHINSYIKQIRGAVGITFLNDKNAQMIDNVGFQFGYATKIRVYGGKLGIGVQLGFLSMKKSDVELNPNQPEDLSIISESVLNFDMKFGVHYQAPTWYAGVSCADILGGIRISGEEGVLKVPQQLYITGGYIWNLKTPVPWSIEPSLLIRTNMATWSFNAMAVARYNGIVWFGLAYELDWALGVVVGAVPFYNHSNAYLKGLEIGAAYSFPLAKFGYSRGGSMGDFEIIFRYGFSFYRDKTLTGYGSSRHLYKNQY